MWQLQKEEIANTDDADANNIVAFDQDAVHHACDAAGAMQLCVAAMDNMLHAAEALVHCTCTSGELYINMCSVLLMHGPPVCRATFAMAR